ncbi:MAG: Bcr/CflA family multidrug efflux MFS transporter [Betaproteobacteria bacterium]|nr:Bcr/CflA family multidrug efflux MFS transporter [Betaproteobacteria bacterium]
MATGPLAIDMYLPALPTIQAEFRVDAPRVQHTLSAYLFGLAIGQLLFGPVADRYGRKRPLELGLALFALAGAGCALATSIESFAALRFAQALGGASGMVLIRAVIRDRFDALQSARVLSLMVLVMGVAPILAPLAGGYLMLHGSWHWIFWFLGGFAVLCIAAVALFLEETHAPERRAPSLLHALAGFGPVARDPRFIGPVLVFVSAFGCFFAYLAAAPFVFIEHFGVPAHQFGWYFGANALGFITVSQLNRKLVTRFGPRRVLGWGVRLLAGAAGVLLLCALTRFGGFLGVFLPIFCFIASVGLIASNATAVAMEPFGARAGGASSLLGASQSLFGVGASALVGAIHVPGPMPMAIVVAVCAAIALAAYTTLVRPPPGSA